MTYPLCEKRKKAKSSRRKAKLRRLELFNANSTFSEYRIKSDLEGVSVPLLFDVLAWHYFRLNIGKHLFDFIYWCISFPVSIFCGIFVGGEVFYRSAPAFLWTSICVFGLLAFAFGKIASVDTDLKLLDV